MNRFRMPPTPDNSSDIDLSPLIDMTFLLLIFFMVTTTFVDDVEMRIERPGASSAETVQQRSIRVAVTASGNVFVNGELVDVYMLQSTLRPALEQVESRHVVVVADRSVLTEQLVEVIDQCRLAGARDVALAVEQSEP
jgi:biopolymer transport protein ExbD